MYRRKVQLLKGVNTCSFKLENIRLLLCTLGALSLYLQIEKCEAW